MESPLEKSLPLWRATQNASELSRSVPKGRPGRPGAGPGLSKAHISPQGASLSENRPPFRVEWWEGAGLFRVVTPYLRPDNWRDDKGTRGEIKEFSADAMRRLRQFLATIPDHILNQSFMVTLTYPGNSCLEAVPSPEQSIRYKTHLDSFGKSLRRRFPGASLVWVLEFQKRGAAHYHALVFGVDVRLLVDLRKWIAKRWNEIVGGDAMHLRAGTQCDLSRSPGGARNYLAKYLSKGNQTSAAKVGRYWGKINAPAIPQGREVVEEVTPQQAVLAVRIARKLSAKRQWVSAWKRLQDRAAKGNEIFGKMTGEEFRAMCYAFAKGATWFTWQTPLGEAGSSAASFAWAVVRDHDARVKMPHRPRTRNNSTVNLYCNADGFRDALTRHPGWKVPAAGQVSEDSPQKRNASRTNPVNVRTYVLDGIRRDFGDPF